jgi:hypothetical protein
MKQSKQFKDQVYVEMPSIRPSKMAMLTGGSNKGSCLR